VAVLKDEVASLSKELAELKARAEKREAELLAAIAQV